MLNDLNANSQRSSRPRVAVIGSGFGGLACAIRLQSQGFETRIFEKRDLPGGRAYVYQDQGFTFDAGPTVITAPDCLEELFALSDRSMADYIKMLPVTPFYRLFWDDGTKFDYSNDIDLIRRQIEQMSPSDRPGYERFLAYTREVFNEGYTKLAAEPFLSWWSMIRVSPQLARLGAHRSVYSTVSKFIKEPHLREAFSFHSLLVGGNPFTTSSIYTLIHYLERNWGVYFPKGGTGALIRSLVKLYEDLGGRIELSSPVDQILTESGRVTGISSQGQTWSCDAVVSNADVVHTYRDMLRSEPRAAASAKRLAAMRHSMSLFLIYFGTKKRYPHLAHHNVLFGPRYKGLLDEIFKGSTLPEDFSLYLHAPTVSDPDLAPPGCEAFYVLSPVAHLGHMPIDWSLEGPRYADRIMRYMEQRYIPGLRENLLTMRIFTPEDFKTQLNAHHGAAFSLEPILTQSAFFRTHNRDSRIEGMYVVGAGTHPGAGVPGVVNSAKATSSLVVRDLAPRLARMTDQIRSLGFVESAEQTAQGRWPGRDRELASELGLER
jgi:phytoene desaturase